MRNYIQPGDSLAVAVPYVSGVTAGQGVLVGARFGVAAVDGAQNAVIECQTTGFFDFAYSIDANRSLTFTLHEVHLALAKTPIEGPAGVEATFDFRAAFNATATKMMTSVLKNQQAETEYA